MEQLPDWSVGSDHPGIDWRYLELHRSTHPPHEKAKILMNLPPGEIVWAIIGFLLSICIFSYLIGDNPLFRFAVHLFIGVSAGVVSVILLYQVLYPRLIIPFLSGSSTGKMITLVPLALGLLLLAKISPKSGQIGTIPSAYLLGAGASITVGGVILGTIFPQFMATINPFGSSTPISEKVEGVIILIASISSLLYFYFGAKLEIGKPLRRPQWIEISAKIGQVFILISLGAIFAGIYLTTISALSERLSSFWNLILGLIG